MAYVKLKFLLPNTKMFHTEPNAKQHDAMTQNQNLCQNFKTNKGLTGRTANEVGHWGASNGSNIICADLNIWDIISVLQEIRLILNLSAVEDDAD